MSRPRLDDYIAAARWLVSAGYTTPSRVVSRGNSNGGLLVAVTAMQAPDAFGAVFCRVPNLDMLGFTRWGFHDAATSANRSGRPPLQSLDELRAAFGETVAVYLVLSPGAPPPAGAASTVVDLTGATLRVLRAGPLTLSEVEQGLDR